MSKTSIEIDGLWMRTKIGSPTGEVEVLIRHEGQWKLAFGAGPGPTAHDPDQLIDHCIHPGGLERVAKSKPVDVGGAPIQPYDAYVGRSHDTRPRRRK